MGVGGGWLLIQPVDGLVTSSLFNQSLPPRKKFHFHSSSELRVWIRGPQAVITQRFSPSARCRCLKKVRLCFPDENPTLYWRPKKKPKKKNPPSRGMPGSRPASLPTSVSQLDSKASLSSRRCGVLVRGQRAESERSSAEFGGASAESNPVCGIIQMEAMPFQDC